MPFWPRVRRRSRREYASTRTAGLRNTVRIGHELGAQFAVYWPGSLGYYVQGAMEESQILELVCGRAECSLRRRHEGGGGEGAADSEALPGGQAVRAAARDSAPIERCDAGVHFLRMLKHPEMVGLNPEYLHELMWGGAVRASLARALMCGKLWHFDINDGYRLKHDVDIASGSGESARLAECAGAAAEPQLQRSVQSRLQAAADDEQSGVFAVSFPTAVDRFITLWEMAGEVMADPIISEAQAL